MDEEPAEGVEPKGSGAGPVRAGSGERETLARELGGDLPCAACRYNLKGLSVRTVCPECGTPVRATILATVDPYASVLRPITWPWATAAGLLAWSLGAMGAAVLTWALRLGDALEAFSGVHVNLHGAARIATICIVISALGALALVRPHSGIKAWRSAGAVLGAAAMLATAWAYWRLHVRFDATHVHPYFIADFVSTERTVLRLIEGTLVVVAIIGLRPNARLLAGRSLLMRMGRVDRQTMQAMAAALGIAALGDGLHLVGPRMHGVMATGAGSVGNFLIAVGSMLLTVGLAGVVIDCVRLAPVVLRAPLSIGKVMGEPDGREREQPATPVADGA